MQGSGVNESAVNVYDCVGQRDTGRYVHQTNLLKSLTHFSVSINSDCSQVKE